MLAGECFMEQELEPGALRLVRGKVLGALDEPDAPGRVGHLVQETVELEEQGRVVWRTVCPLSDAHFMVDNCPVKWARASYALRERIEAGVSISLDDELRLLKGG